MSYFEAVTAAFFKRASETAARSMLDNPLIYLFAIALAEGATWFLAPPIGMGLHALLLLILILRSAVFIQKKDENFFLALAFAPLIRLVSLSLPLEYFSALQSYLVMAFPLAASAYLAARVMGISSRSLGLTVRNLRLQLLTIVCGLGIGLIAYGILQPEPLIQDLEWGQLWLPALVILTAAGLLEELIYRGILQTTAVDSFGHWGIPVVATIYAVMHIGQGSVLFVVFVWLVGLFFGLISKSTRSILGVALAHGIANVGLYLVFPVLLRDPGLYILNLSDLVPFKIVEGLLASLHLQETILALLGIH